MAIRPRAPHGTHPRRRNRSRCCVLITGCTKSEDDDTAVTRPAPRAPRSSPAPPRRPARPARCSSTAHPRSTSRTPSSASPSRRRRPTRSGSPRPSRSRTRRRRSASRSCSSPTRSRSCPSRSATSRTCSTRAPSSSSSRRSTPTVWSRRCRRPRRRRCPSSPIDRKVNSTACKDYVAFLGSDFVEQGKRAADAMIKATGRQGQGGDPARLLRQQRDHGPHQGLRRPDQGQGARHRDRRPADRRVRPRQGPAGHGAAHPVQPRHHRRLRRERRDGARRGHRAKAAGKKPGKDVKIVSIDGTRNAVQAIVDGDYQRRHRVQPALRPAGLRDRAGVLRRRGDPRERHHRRPRSTTRPTPRHRSAARTEDSPGAGAPGRRLGARTRSRTWQRADRRHGGRAVHRARRQQAVPRRPGPRRRVSFSLRAGRGARARRRERRRQVDPHQGAHRRLPAGRRRGALPPASRSLRPARSTPSRPGSPRSTRRSTSSR